MIGSGATLGAFNARLGMDSSGYTQGMLRANAISSVFGSTFSAFVANPLLGGIALFKQVGGAAIKAGVGIAKFAGETLEGAEALERMSQQTGASVQLLRALEKRLEIAGFGADKAGQSFNFMNKFVADAIEGGKIAVDLLDTMGVSLDGIDSSDDRFRALFDGLVGIQDQALRSDAAMQIFGRTAGIEVLNAIGGGSVAIDAMVKQYTDLGFVVESSVNTAFSDMNTHIGFTKQAVEGVKQSAINNFLIGLTGDLEITDAKIISIAENINSQLAPSMQEFGRMVPPLIEDIVPLVTALTDLLEVIQGLQAFVRDVGEGTAEALDSIPFVDAFQSTVALLDTTNPAIAYGRLQQFKNNPGEYITHRAFAALD